MALSDFRAELVGKINAAGVDCPLFMQDVLHPPCAFVAYEVGDALTFQHGAYAYTWHVALVAPRNAVDDAQAWLDSQLDTSDASSLWRVLCDASWVHCDYVRPISAGEIQVLPLGGPDALMVDITLEVVL